MKTTFRSSTVLGRLNAVASGAGFGIIPCFLAAAEKERVPFLPARFVKKVFWLQVYPDSRQYARVRATIDFIADQVASSRNPFQSLPGREVSSHNPP